MIKMTETLVVAESMAALTYITEQAFDERSATTMTPFCKPDQGSQGHDWDAY